MFLALVAAIVIGVIVGAATMLDARWRIADDARTAAARAHVDAPVIVRVRVPLVPA